MYNGLARDEVSDSMLNRLESEQFGLCRNVIKSYQSLAAAWSVEQFLDGSFGPEIGPVTKADDDGLGASPKTEYAAKAAVKASCCCSSGYIFLSRKGKGG